MAILSAIGSALGAIGSAAGGIAANIAEPVVSGIFSKFINDKNVHAQKDINRENLENAFYWNTQQLEQNNIQRSRDDTQNQRAVADRLAAGLSPVGTDGLSSSVSSSFDPHVSQSIAPQQDASGYVSAINAAASNLTQYAIAKLQSSDKAADRQTQEKLAGLQIQAQKDMCNANISANAEIEDKRLAQEDLKMNLDYKKYLGTLDYQIKALNSAVSSRNFSVYNQANQATIDSIKNWAASAGVRVEFKPFDVNSDKDLEVIKERNSLFDSQVQAGYKSYSSWRESASPEQLAALYSKSSSSSKSSALGGSLGAGVAGVGNGSIGLNGSSGESIGDSETISQSNQVNTIRMSEFFPKTLVYYYPSYNESYYKAMHTK